MAALRLLLVADTHVGFDAPLRPRVARRRRGDDFLRNYRLALDPARRGEVHAVVHGGDLLHRSRTPPALVQAALEPLLEVARRGVPVLLVPGNHERGRIPNTLLARHRSLHILHGPATCLLELDGVRVALGGFPFSRRVDGAAFRGLLAASGLPGARADLRLLCLHQAVEGARVGPVGFTFRPGPQVVRGTHLPPGLAAVLCGHIHRHQVLERDLSGRPLPAPVCYPGSVERTAFAERGEPKGHMILELVPGGEPGVPDGGALSGWRFVELPARPMVLLDEEAATPPAALERRLVRRLAGLPADAVVRVRLRGLARDAPAPIPAARLRALAPASMNIELRAAGPPR